MELSFTKMEATGNDYLFFDGLEKELPPLPWDEVARSLSHRHFGVGSDGIILMRPGHKPGLLRMEMYNADGSRGKICGNGLRSFALLAHQRGYTQEHLVVETDAGDVKVEVLAPEEAAVHLGQPRLDPASVPTLLPATRQTALGPAVLQAPLEVLGEILPVSSLSMGNPHVVLFLEDAPHLPSRLEDIPLSLLGPALAAETFFPEGANAEVVKVLSPEKIRLRVWERGSGETLSCGSGAAAAAAAAILLGHGRSPVAVEVPGGLLEVIWDDEVILRGPAREVFQGKVNWPL
ncbi:MAG: diaminopimelate epimerase [Bacillota bacterium]|nr:diaminopimelate epimerase [Bacillota bacterium]